MMHDTFLTPQNSLAALSIKEGAYYINGLGDRVGPMDCRTGGLFSDNFGRLYFGCGQVAGHTHDSAANLVRENADG